MDEDGYCRIVGRLKDMVIRGGENIYPIEIEQVLYQHPKIKDIQVKFVLMKQHFELCLNLLNLNIVFSITEYTSK